jgi:hypothetical protein
MYLHSRMFEMFASGEPFWPYTLDIITAVLSLWQDSKREICLSMSPLLPVFHTLETHPPFSLVSTFGHRCTGVTGWYRTRRPLHWDRFWCTVIPFELSSLPIHTPELSGNCSRHLVAKQEEVGEKWPLNFVYEVSLFILVGFFNMP